MKKISKIIDILLLLFAWALAVLVIFGLFVSIESKYYTETIVIGVPSVLVLLVVYTRHWVTRWRKQ